MTGFDKSAQRDERSERSSNCNPTGSEKSRLIFLPEAADGEGMGINRFRINRIRGLFKGKIGKAVFLVLGIMLSQDTAFLFLGAFEDLDSWFGNFLNDSDSIYCGCALLLLIILVWFFSGKGFAQSVLTALVGVGAFLFIELSEKNGPVWSSTTYGILCFALTILLVLVFSWKENGDRYTKVFLAVLTTVYAIGLLNITLVWEDDIWKVLFRVVVVAMLLMVSCRLIISAMGKRAFSGLTMLAAFACAFQTCLWFYIMRTWKMQPFPDGIISVTWHKHLCLAAQKVLMIGFGVSAVVLRVQSFKKTISDSENEKSGSDISDGLIKHLGVVIITIVLLFAAVISGVLVIEKDKRWKHLGELLETGNLAEAVEWMDLHPWDIPGQEEYREWLLSCMAYERSWEYDLGNSALIPLGGNKHELKPLLSFCPHVTISYNVAYMQIEDEEGNCLFELSGHNDGRGFNREWGRFLFYEMNQDGYYSSIDAADCYLVCERDNRLIFLQYDMDRVLMDYCVYRAAGTETDPARALEQEDLEIRERWVFNPFYEKVELIGG